MADAEANGFPMEEDIEASAQTIADALKYIYTLEERIVALEEFQSQIEMEQRGEDPLNRPD